MEMDTQGNVTFVNKFAQDFFGYKESEILGQNVLGTIVAADPAGQGHDNMIEDIAIHPENYLHNEKENILRNGDKVWIVWTYKPILDERNNLKEILCIGINKTEQKKAEDIMAQQLKEKTAMEERNRLARDLHDAVSQTLFSTSLIAEVLPRLWERNPDEGKRRLEEIRSRLGARIVVERPVALKDAELRLTVSCPNLRTCPRIRWMFRVFLPPINRAPSYRSEA
jgi:PAS domain S-box-containing protein